MKRTFGLILFLIAGLTAKAQAPNYDDLKILYADANYEKLTKVAEGYTLKEDNKKDALPFVWLAKGLYKISLSGTDDEKYKNAYKDAIAALGKALKNDKDGSQLTDHTDFIEEFQLSMAIYIENDISAKDYSKASGWILKYYKVYYYELCEKCCSGWWRILFLVDSSLTFKEVPSYKVYRRR
jgi:hypothetical protein